ncbi:MAG: hypothetical protein EOO17_03510 [Chloroflexi bacterium]|nr:MAG: hypothetical protein EOO17_03510 [Chloroflexota bacterium]
MKVNKYISLIAIVLGVIWVVAGLIVIVMSKHDWLVDNGFVSIVAGVSYIGIGYILRYAKDRKVICISLVSLMLLTVCFVLLPIVKGEGVGLDMLMIVYLALLSFEFGRMRKLHL